MRGGVKLVGGGGVAAAAAGAGHPGMWRTPTPYLFLGFALMMGLIAVALLVLVCTRRKQGGRDGGDAEAASALKVLVPLDREPMAVVIMAGDTAPSFLASAKPLASFLPPPPPPSAGEP
ncbi:protein GLUTAMINE DUMPER 6-like [Oryza brachyantha]|uniref:protein GLUTAMINE DUMPER 6-like n=1 Tax=Oryza brachyantha TaxID=4533 RepID=UPI001ADAF205|nr:protein GLUTAMINE DUMPER 6-like [Oryza brachyantha]